MKNKQYLVGIGILLISLIVLEQLLRLRNISESYLFLIFWIIFFTWIIFGKRLLNRQKWSS